MDLLKIALRLAPWCAPDDVADALACALEARALDVAASPYDARAFGLAPVRVETDQGRAEYRARQAALMARVRPVRERLLRRYAPERRLNVSWAYVGPSEAALLQVGLGTLVGQQLLTALHARPHEWFRMSGAQPVGTTNLDNPLFLPLRSAGCTRVGSARGGRAHASTREEQSQADPARADEATRADLR